jgi:hypothetical protein
MALELPRPFAAYVSIEAFPGSGDTRRYVLHLRYELAGTWESGELTWPWVYAVPPGGDGQNGTSGYEQRLAEEIENFRRHVEYELELQERRLFERAGGEALVLAQREQSDGHGG